MVKTILFDKDGILTDTEEFNYLLVRDVFRKYGVEVTHKQFIDSCTKLKRQAYTEFKPEGLDLSYEEYLKEKEDLYYRTFDTNFRLMPGVEEALDLLEKRFHGRMAIATGNKGYRVEHELKNTILGKYISVLGAVEYVKNNKPDPEIYELCAKRMGTDPKDCIVVEDAGTGVVSAKRAGMRCIAIPTKLTHDDDFSMADHICKDIIEAAGLIIDMADIT
jgi:HAD superfamily hydrolase (TIGR01509 family)